MKFSTTEDKHRLTPCMKIAEYKRERRELQVELVKLQRHIIRENLRGRVIFERIVRHLSPRETRVIAGCARRRQAAPPASHSSSMAESC